MEISIQTSFLEKDRLQEEMDEGEDLMDNDAMDETLEDQQNDTILAQVDPNLETILEDGGISQNSQRRDLSPTGSNMSLRSGGSRASRMSTVSGWGEDQKDEARLLREKIKNFDPAWSVV